MDSLAQAFWDDVFMSFQSIKDQWQPRAWTSTNAAIWLARLPTLLSVLLALMAAWLLVRLLWLLIVGPTVDYEALESADALDSSTSMSTPASSRSVAWSLFASDDTRQSEQAARLPVDDSQLSLVGVVYTRGPTVEGQATGYAVIRGASSGDQIFQVGEALPDGRTIEQIEPNAVVLTGPQGRRVLSLDERRDAALADTSPDASAAGEAAADELDWAQGVGVASLGGLTGAPGSSSVDSDRQGVAMVRVPSGGYRLRPGPQAEWFVQAGLEINDVLLAINGQPIEAQLQSGGDLTEWVGRIMQGERIALTVDRNGQRVTIEPSSDALQRVLESAGG